MSETERIEAIHALPEAAGRPKLATHLAQKTDCAVQDARGILEAAPLERKDCDLIASRVSSLARYRGVPGFAPTNEN